MASFTPRVVTDELHSQASGVFMVKSGDNQGLNTVGKVFLRNPDNKEESLLKVDKGKVTMKDVKVTGNLVVEGETTSIRTEQLSVDDSHVNLGAIHMANDNAGFVTVHSVSTPATTVQFSSDVDNELVIAPATEGDPVTRFNANDDKALDTNKIYAISGCTEEKVNGLWAVDEIKDGSDPPNIIGYKLTSVDTGAPFLLNTGTDAWTSQTIGGTFDLHEVTSLSHMVMRPAASGGMQYLTSTSKADFDDFDKYKDLVNPDPEQVQTLSTSSGGETEDVSGTNYTVQEVPLDLRTGNEATLIITAAADGSTKPSVTFPDETNKPFVLKFVNATADKVLIKNVYSSAQGSTPVDILHGDDPFFASADNPLATVFTYTADGKWTYPAGDMYVMVDNQV